MARIRVRPTQADVRIEDAISAHTGPLIEDAAGQLSALAAALR